MSLRVLAEAAASNPSAEELAEASRLMRRCFDTELFGSLLDSRHKLQKGFRIAWIVDQCSKSKDDAKLISRNTHAQAMIGEALARNGWARDKTTGVWRHASFGKDPTMPKPPAADPTMPKPPAKEPQDEDECPRSVMDVLLGMESTLQTFSGRLSKLEQILIGRKRQREP